MSAVARCEDCGYVKRARTVGLAEFGIRRHSCDRHRARIAAARDALAREAARDRTPKPCLHKIAQHQHGTHACFVLDRCRCIPCTVANTNYEAARARDRAYGIESFVDAAPTVAHLRVLMGAGLGWKRVAHLAGVAESSVYPLLYGRPDRNGGKPRTKIRPTTAEKILAVPVPRLGALAGGAKVDPTGTGRRVRALVAHGWSLTALADQTGIDHQVLRAVANNTRRFVVASSARAVRAAYDELWDLPVPESVGKTRALDRARREGWPPPAAWDDDAIDDPAALPARGWRDGECADPGCPETDVVARGLCRVHYDALRRPPRHSQVDLDEVLHLVRAGESSDQVAERLGVAFETIRTKAARHGRDDVLVALRRSRETAAA
ncbi:helix-turn-helix domain-containing protein [Cellulosimicrobium cellulans]|uniref:helix-turn-helix domain-containing protein n=1 Tax=Cellulosimicrobium cellulans TaxID=1710 RepID=UPI00214A453A|nr:helix-turn-helix domain-containing protein [Cellulosimicrobium cellulans]